MTFWKDSMINRLSNLINRNRSAAKISQVLCSNIDPTHFKKGLPYMDASKRIFKSNQRFSEEGKKVYLLGIKQGLESRSHFSDPPTTLSCPLRQNM